MEIITIESDAFKQIVASIHELKNLINKKLDNTPESRIHYIEKTWLNRNEVCKILQVCEKTLQNYRRKKIIPFSRVSNKIYYRASDIQAHLMSHYHRNKL